MCGVLAGNFFHGCACVLVVYRARPSLLRVILLSHALNYEHVWRGGREEGRGRGREREKERGRRKEANEREQEGGERRGEEGPEKGEGDDLSHHGCPYIHTLLAFILNEQIFSILQVNSCKPLTEYFERP